MSQDLHRTRITGKTVLIGVGLGVLAWMFEAAWDVYVARKGTLESQLLSPPLDELPERLFIMLFFAGFGMYSSTVIEYMKKSGERLRHSENRYRNLVDTIGDGIFTVSLDGTFAFLNPAFETITGFPMTEWVGKHFQSIIHPDDVPKANNLFLQLLEGNTPGVFELKIRSRSGDGRTVEITAAPQKTGNRVVSILGIARDITERKKVEQSLQESEARYRDLFENANDLIQSIAPDGTFQYVNRSWRETLGYSEHEVRRLTMLDIVHADCRVHCMEVFQGIMSGQHAGRIETTFITKEGRPVLVEGSVNCSFVDGRPVATRAIFRNITAHRRAEDFINNILETVDEGFIIISPDLRVTSANKAYCSNLKLSPGEIIGRHCYEMSHHSARPCYEEGEECPVRRTFETGEPYTAVHQHYDREGNAVYFEIKSFPLKDSLGKIMSAIEIHNDISDKKRLEEQLRHAQKMEAVGTLAGGVAHDFNNILTAIIGYGSLLQMKIGETDPLRPLIDHILVSGERAANLTQGLLTFSRKQLVRLKEIDVNSLVGRVEKILTRLIGEDIEVTVIPVTERAAVKADAGQIEQILINLATNARDAMPQGGRLVIKTEFVKLDNEFIKLHGYGKPGRYVLLSVSDTGSGMDKKTVQRIFEPFFTTKGVGKGTGLGLSIVYGIVKQHGGYINVYSEAGAGTTFKVYLPHVCAAAEEAKSSEVMMPPGGSATVLIAEDDVNVRIMTKTLLANFGYTVIEAADGDEAVAKYRANSDVIDLLILDVIMPKKNGKEAYEMIRALNPRIKAIFLSGYTAEIIHQRGLLNSDAHFLSKPVSPRELLLTVSRLMADADHKQRARAI